VTRVAETLTIALDAMGGDAAPGAVVDGAGLALVRHPRLRFVLFGDAARIEPLLEAKPALAAASVVRHTDAVVGPEDKPGQALRRGRDSSMWLAIEAVQKQEAQAVVSGGNTGALMAMAKFQLGTLEGIHRPAIASIWPTQRGQTVMLDLGANIDCGAKDLVEFAVMGAAFARVVLGLSRPKVGLLNIGVEAVKGNEPIKQAAHVLREVPLAFEFFGFVEGDGISAGNVDVVVTDGFTGNIALKTAEGVAKMIAAYLGMAMRRTWMTKLGYLFAHAAFGALRARFDPRAHNGGVFLGLNGLAVKSHGGTDALGFASALELAFNMAEGRLSETIAADMRQTALSGIATDPPGDSDSVEAAAS
jgi:glycerol-3-phosphate acyltransferase PlsX